MPSNPDDLWRAYHADRSLATRNELVTHYLPIVRPIAFGLARHWGRRNTLDDLACTGAIGLLRAVEAFDPACGVKFISYAAIRIRGAILDHFRALDPVPRLIRQHELRLGQVRADLRRLLGREPESCELHAASGLSAEHFGAAVGVRREFSLEQVLRSEGRELELADVLDDAAQSWPARRRELRDEIHRLLRGLTTRERLVVILYWLEGWTMKQIGASFGLSEARISQWLSELLERLQRRAAAESFPF